MCQVPRRDLTTEKEEDKKRKKKEKKKKHSLDLRLYILNTDHNLVTATELEKGGLKGRKKRSRISQRANMFLGGAGI